jgi:hypothetical protein
MKLNEQIQIRANGIRMHIDVEKDKTIKKINTN